MQLILTHEEVTKIVLEKVNETFSTNFNEIKFDGYSKFTEATLSMVLPNTTEVQS